MTLVVQLPPRPSRLEEIEGEPGAVSAVGDLLRRAANGLSDAVEAAVASGLPPDFEGRASDAAGSAMRDFGADGDGVVAALLEGLAAVETYGDRLVELERRRGEVADERTYLDGEIDALAASIETATEERVPALREESETLRRRVEAWEGTADRWWSDVGDAERAVADALSAVDSVEEGREAASATDRPDVDALTRELSAIEGGPQAVNDWWNSLSTAEQEALTAVDPALVGGTDGIPASTRDEANRLSLGNDLDRLQSVPADQLSEADRRLLERALETEDALQQGRTEVDPSTGEPLERLLLLYQPGAADGDGYSALAFGNPDTADHTAVTVPGITNDGSTLGGNAANALDLWKEASAEGESVSTVAWLGYDAPSMDGFAPDELADMGNVLTQQQAAAAGEDLADFVGGLRSTHEGDPTDMTVIGHSYGSSTVAQALASGMGDDVDQGVLLGSPGAGLGVESADELVGEDGDLYVGSRDRDPVTWLGDQDGYGPQDLPGVEDLPGVPGLPGIPGLPGLPGVDDLPVQGPFGLGTDPAHEDFGATRIDVGEGDANPMSYLDNHTTYYEGEGLEHMGDIVAGRDLEDGAVVDGRDQTGGELATDAGRDALADAAGDVWDGVTDGAGALVDGAGGVLDDVGERLLPSPDTFAGVFG